jgi:fluoroacetyl-CoA thioesterase
MLEPGITGTVSLRVREADLASAFAGSNGEQYPDVLSTPALLGLMERACARAMAADVDEHHLSVGVKTELAHLQPTAPHVDVTARATLTAIEGALYWFDIEASDNAGAIGRGRHARAIVARASIEQRAEQRRTLHTAS